jgi:4-hydroxybenzoate polyprenyltransferase
MQTLITFARMVKIEHSVFALPFAYIGAFLAADGWPGWRVFIFLTVAMVAVRSFAMAANRLADLDIDRENPRTQGRELVNGAIGLDSARLFTVLAALVFVLACAAINWWCFALSPLALFWSAFYSLTKRFTWLSHYALGSVLGLAPIAGWIAVRPEFTVSQAAFFLGVTFWVAGFDLLYACQDADFDRRQGLHSVPADKGVGTALTMAAFSHVTASLFFLLGGFAAGVGLAYYPVWAAVAAVLAWEHTLIAEDDMSRVNTAFFTANGVVAVALFAGVLLSQAV